MTLFLIGCAAFCSTMLGGALALKLRDRLHLVLGFSAGAVVAVAFFDLMPEALNLAGKSHELSTVMSCVGLGFLLYLLMDRLLLLHGHSHEDGDAEHVEVRGHVRAGSLSIHSFLDGVGIGLAFQVSPIVGFVVATAVLAHDFSDGINTVSMIIRHGGNKRQALKWLAIDAIAPVAGVLSTFLFSISESSLSIILAVFCGFFIYIGASDLLPESHHSHPTRWTTFATVLGMAVIYFAVHLAGI